MIADHWIYGLHSFYILSIQTVIGYTSVFHPEGALLRQLHIFYRFIALLVTTFYNAFTMNFLKNIIYNPQISCIDRILFFQWNIYSCFKTNWSNASPAYTSLHISEIVLDRIFDGKRHLPLLENNYYYYYWLNET